MLKPDYESICMQEEPYKALLEALLRTFKGAERELQTDIERMEDERKKIESVSYTANDLQEQSLINEKILDELIEDCYKKIFKLKDLHSTLKRSESEFISSVAQEVETHMKVIDGAVKKYIQMKNNLVKIDGLSQEDIDKRLTGYRQAVSNQKMQLEKDIGRAKGSLIEYRFKINEINKVMSTS
jgi:hypothetical protein